MLLHIALPQSIYTTEMGKPTNHDPFPALKSQLIAIYQHTTTKSLPIAPMLAREWNFMRLKVILYLRLRLCFLC